MRWQLALAILLAYMATAHSAEFEDSGAFLDFRLRQIDQAIIELDERLKVLEAGEPPPITYDLPGRIEAEDFKAYHDTTAGNRGGECREEDVDVELTGDADGLCNIGWIVAGEWLQYTVNVKAGRYDVNLRVASMPGASRGFRLSINDESLGDIAVPATGGWQAWQTVTLHGIELSGGQAQVLTLEALNSNININWIDFVPASENNGSIEPLWEDDFSGDWRSRWPLKWSEPDDRYATKEYFERDGETWIRVVYPAGETGKGFKLVTDHDLGDRAYLQYRLRFNDDFDWVIGGKIPGLIGGSVAAGEKPDGTDGWAARVMWAADGKGFAYVYHPDMPGSWGENIHFPSDVRFQKGVIHTLGLEVVMNTPGQHDGILRVWLDGDLVVERTDMRWRDVPELQIDGMSFGSIFGGNTPDWAPAKDERIEFGDFKLYEASRR